MPGMLASLARLAPPVRVLVKAPKPQKGYRRLKVFDFAEDHIDGDLPLPEIEYLGPACVAAPTGSRDVAAQRKRVARARGLGQLTERLTLARALWVQSLKTFEPLMAAKSQKNHGLVAKLKARIKRSREEYEGLIAYLVKHPKCPAHALCWAGRMERKSVVRRFSLWERFLKSAPTHRAADGIRLELAAGYLGIGRKGGARAHLAGVRGRDLKVRAYGTYLKGHLAFFEHRLGLAQKLWRGVYSLAVKHKWRSFRRTLRKDLMRLLSRTLGTGDPVWFVTQWIGVHEPKQVSVALKLLATYLHKRGDNAACIKTLEELLKLENLDAQGRGESLISILEAYINQSRRDLMARRVWTYLACVARGACGVPARQTLASLVNLVGREAVALHAQVLKTRQLRHADLARHLYVLTSVLPAGRAPMWSHPRMALRRVRLELFIRNQLRSHCPACPRPRFTSVPRPRPPRIPPTWRRGRRPVVVFSGRPRIFGALGAVTIRRVVRRQLPQVRACYEDALMRRRRVKGKIRLSWEIGALGLTAGGRIVTDTTGDAALGRCILSKVAAWRFPEVWNTRSHISYTFVFKPASR